MSDYDYDSSWMRDYSREELEDQGVTADWINLSRSQHPRSESPINPLHSIQSQSLASGSYQSYSDSISQPSHQSPHQSPQQQQNTTSRRSSYYPATINTGDILGPSSPGSVVSQGAYTPVSRPAWDPSRIPSSRLQTPGEPVPLSLLMHPPIFTVEGEAAYGLADNFPEDSKFRQNYPFDANYYPASRNIMSTLWKGVGIPASRQDKKWIELIDHVDFYRIIYITVVLRGNVSMNSDSIAHDRILQNIAAIFNAAGHVNTTRPPGFDHVLKHRRSNITNHDLRKLFKLLDNKSNPERAKPLDWVLDWAIDKTWGTRTPKRILNGVPEAIWNHFGLTFNQCFEDKRNYCWEWDYMWSFQYDQHGSGWRLSGPRTQQEQSQQQAERPATQTSTPQGTQPYQQVAESSGTSVYRQQPPTQQWGGQSSYGSYEAGPSGTQLYDQQETVQSLQTQHHEPQVAPLEGQQTGDHKGKRRASSNTTNSQNSQSHRQKRPTKPTRGY